MTNVKSLHTRAKGNIIENLATSYLQQHGLTLIERNFCCHLGEIDIICQDQQDLVFVEVRYRQTLNFGTPAESINRKKQQKLKTTATIYIQARQEQILQARQRQINYYITETPAKKHAYTHSEPNYRFDVIAVSGNLNSPDIEWLQNVIL